jgi:ABC-type Zn uptake system ZnuABC Zn-binding protein ZnuA
VFAVAAIVRTLRRFAPARVKLAVALLPILGVAVAGCGAASAGSSNGRVDVLATTTQIADWARVIGGHRVDVHQVLKPNTDPHEYEPRPADVQAAANAKLVLTNGNGLDAWATKLTREAGGHPQVVDLGSGLPDELPGERTGPERSAHDPHWWHDPANAVAASARIADALGQVDPGGRSEFARNAGAYEAKVRKLDRQIGACLGRVPAARRKLVTDHDAFGYFAHRYGIEVVGAVIPSQTTQAQPSAGELSKLVDLVRREHVLAVFPEHSLSAKLAQAIARDTGASAGLELYGDTLGPSGGAAATYLDMEATNARTIALGLTAGRVRCSVGGA